LPTDDPASAAALDGIAKAHPKAIRSGNDTLGYLGRSLLDLMGCISDK
jgi:hypothetical protein